MHHAVSSLHRHLLRNYGRWLRHVGLADNGVGLTATGKKVDSPAKLKVRATDGPDGMHVKLDAVPLDHERTRRVAPETLRKLCIDFQSA